MLIMVGSSMPTGVDPNEPKQAASTETPRPTSTETPKPCTQRPPALDPDPSIYTVRMRNADDNAAADHLFRKIKPTKKRVPGLMLLFGVTFNPEFPYSGDEVSRAMKRLLEPRFRNSQPVIRPFHQVYGPGHRRTGEIKVEVYFFERLGKDCR
jgi:hypothetical protein